MSFVLVHTGSRFPRHVVHNLRQIRAFNPRTDIHFIVEDDSLDRLSSIARTDPCLFLHPASRFHGSPGSDRISLQYALQATPNRIPDVDAGFRDGFWIHTVTRFFYLHALMAEFGLRDVVHVENDVLVYFELEEVLDELAGQMHVTRDAPDRVIGGIVFVKTHRILEDLRDFACAPDTRFDNDMDLLSKFQDRRRELVRCLPIIDPDYFPPDDAESRTLYANDYDKFQAVFDSAYIGQYLDGVDPRNASGDTRGFVNETSVVEIDTDDQVSFDRDELGRGVPYLSCRGRRIRVMSLHLHSKNLGRYLSGSVLTSGPTSRE